MAVAGMLAIAVAAPAVSDGAFASATASVAVAALEHRPPAMKRHCPNSPFDP